MWRGRWTQGVHLPSSMFNDSSRSRSSEFDNHRGPLQRLLLRRVYFTGNRGITFSRYSAASFAARMTDAREQPGRERPHLWTPHHRPTVGSGVAHVPAAGDRNRSKRDYGNAHRLSPRIAPRVYVLSPCTTEA